MTEEPMKTPEPKAHRKAGLISRRFLRQRLKQATNARASIEALDAAEAWFERQFARLVEVAVREHEREKNARAAQHVQFRTPPLKRAHLAPFIDPPAEPPRGAVSSLGPQEVEVGRADTPKGVHA